MNRAILPGLVILAAPTFATAQLADALADRLEARTLREEARTEARELRAPVDPAAPPAIKWKVSLGAAHTDAEDGGETWSTPFSLKATYKKTALKLSGDGYTHAESNGETKSGMSDMLAAVSHRFVDNNSRLVGEIGLGIPAGGEVGSSSGQQRIGATFLGPLFESWIGLVSAKLIRSNAEPPAGVSRLTRAVLLQAGYQFAPATATVLQLSRRHTPGRRGTTAATVTQEFPLTDKNDEGLSGSFGFTRGLTSGKKDNTLEFSLSLPF